MISVMKTKDNRWEAMDEKGNIAVGNTKEIALKNYTALFGRDNSKFVGFDFSKINIDIGG